jgi:chromosome segregation ATPase
MKLPLVVPIFLFLAGCAHQAVHYSAPDSSKLRASSGKLAEKVTAAKATAARASAAISAAKLSTDRESARIAEIAPRVENLLRVSPVELRPEIEALKGEVEDLKTDHEETVSHVDAAVAEQKTLGAQLEEANAAKNEVAQYGPEYFAKVDKLTDELNAAEVARAKDSKALLWYRLHWWAAWIVAGLGVVVCVVLAFLKATGRLALSIPRI